MATRFQHGQSDSRERMMAGEGGLMNEYVIRNAEELEALLGNNQQGQSQHLGEMLVADRVITTQQLEDALRIQQREQNKHLGKLLTEMGLASTQQITSALARKLGIPFVQVRDYVVAPRILACVPQDVAIEYNVLPLARVNSTLIVAMENPFDTDAMAMVRFNTTMRVEVVIAPVEELRQALHKHYGHAEEQEAYNELDFDRIDEGADDEHKALNVEQEAMKKPIVRLVNAIILQAINQRASDIHIRPEKGKIEVLYRIDGTLVPQRTLRRNLLPMLVSRIKITGGMNIAERRLPQDGHARTVRAGHQIDLRISCIPTVIGESVVIRILDKEAGVKPFNKIGLKPQDEALLRAAMQRSTGMILVTGPTGAGKSTTLYAVLNELRARGPHIITVEDPVEYDMDGIEQIQVHAKRNYGFAEALRHILRHDPDVVMIGEIRDLETARIANKAALTGHLVLSTLHTNDAASAVTRLMDMGIEPYLLSSTLSCVMAQRLVRLNCTKCLAEEAVAPEVRETIGVSQGETFHRGTGCSHCNHTGYFGRTLVYELLNITPAVGQLISAAQTATAIKNAALSEGMMSLTHNALALARTGKISLEEVYAVRLE
jgi:type IV pilus assembly protein PilB